MNLIGITGNIGSGKSETGRILKSLGYVVFDMDVWCRQMYHDTLFLQKIKENFPYTFEKGVFNKRLLRQTVFSNIKELQKLEALTHPYLVQKFIKTAHRFRFSPYPVFIQTALLYQMNLFKYCQKVIYTTAPYHIIKERVIKRDGVKSSSVDDILKNQLQSEVCQKYADIVLQTDTDLSVLKAEIIKILIKEIEC